MENIHWHSHPLFSMIPTAYGIEAFQSGKWIHKKYQKNQILHLEGDPCSGLELVLAGEIHIVRIQEDGSTMILSIFQSGDLIGGNLLFSENPVFPMMVQAKTISQIIYIPKDEIFDLCCSNKEFLQKFLESISHNANFLGDKIRSHLQISLRQRILRYIEKESLQQGSPTIKLPGSKKILANQLGVARTSLSRTLHQLKEEGILDFDRSTITRNYVHDPSSPR